MPSALQPVRGAFLPGRPGVLDVGPVNVDISHSGGDPGMPEHLLDRDQVQSALVELGGA